MAKGDVTLKFDAQDAQFVQSMVKMRQEMLAMADTARKMGVEVKKSGDTFEWMASKVIATVGTLDLIGKGAQAASGAFDNYFGRMSARADDLERKVAKVNASMAAGGQSSAAPEVRSELRAMSKQQIGGRDVIPDELYQAYDEISRTMGNRVDTSTKLKASETAMLARAAKMDQGGATEVGENFARLSRKRRPGGGLEGYSDQKLQDMSYQLAVGKPGGLSDYDLRFFSRSRDKTKALNVLLAGAQSDENSRALSSIQEAADEDISEGDIERMNRERRRNPRQFAGGESERKLRLSQIPKEDRIDAMLADSTLAPQKDRLAIRNLARGVSRVQPAQSLAGIAESRQRSGDNGDQLQRVQEGVEADEQRLRDSTADADLAEKMIQKRRELEFRKNNPNAELIPGLTELQGRTGLLGPFKSFSPPGASSLPPSMLLDPKELQRQLSIAPTHRHGISAGPVTQDSMHLKNISEGIGHMLGHLAAQTSTLRTRRDTSLSNDSEGQK